MYKRRFASLRFHEANLSKTRRFFFGDWRFCPNQLFHLLEMEMKFMCDYLFSKSSGTAFSLWGVVMRVVNIFVLGVCWYLIVGGVGEIHSDVQRTVTYIVMSVAVAVEGLQLGRIVVSDWSMVWVVCESVRQSRKLTNTWRSTCTANLIRCVANLLDRLRKAVGVGGSHYWQNRIPQLSVMETCWSAGSYSGYGGVIRKVVGLLWLEEFVMRWYITAVTASHITGESVEDDFKCRLLNDFKDNEEAFDARKYLSVMRIDEEGVGWEHYILAWHVVTTVLEKLEDESKIEDEEVKRAFNFSVRMSGYFAYLVVTCPELLPVDAENAKGVYRELFSDMKGKMGEHATLHHFCNNFKHSDMSGGSFVLREAQQIVTEALEQSVEERWNDLAVWWFAMLGRCGVYDKCGEHGERVTEGGELVSLVWVLMGHIGWAEESYIPTAMKTDPNML